MDFTEVERAAFSRLLALALDEDLGQAGDITSQTIIPVDLQGIGLFRARRPGVVSGLPCLSIIGQALHPDLTIELTVVDGSIVNAGSILARIRGPVRAILAGE